MIRFATQDSHGAIKWFDKKETNHLMGEGETRERKQCIRTVIDFLRESLGTTNNEDKPATATVHARLHPLCQFDATKLLAVFIKQNNIVS